MSTLRVLLAVVLLGGIVVWLASNQRRVDDIVTAVKEATVGKTYWPTFDSPKSAPATTIRGPAPSRRLESTPGDAAPASVLRSSAEDVELSDPARSAVAAPSRPGFSPGNALGDAAAEFEAARAMFDREDYAGASAGFARAMGLVEHEPDLGGDLRRVAGGFAAISRARAARLYRDGDANVVPPVIISRSSLPASAAPGTPSAQADILELVIDAEGSVEKARLITPRRQYRNQWWVSVAKTWRFRPALKDGNRVRFVARIPLNAG